MELYRWVVLAHVIAGSVALLCFWLAGLARKGSPFHKRVGKIYLQAMLGVLITGVFVSVVALLRARYGIGTFLLYLVVITATSCWLSWIAIQRKRDASSFYTRGFVALAVANVISGLIVFAIGLQLSAPLLMGFCWVGVFVGIGMLRRFRAPKPANWAVREHFSAMIGNGVATHIAFLAIGINRLLSEAGVPGLGYIAWFAPLVVAVIVGIVLDRRYAPVFRPTRA